MGKMLWLTLEFPPEGGGVGRMYRELGRALPPGAVVVWAPPCRQNADNEALEPFTLRRAPLLARAGPFRWWKLLWTLPRYVDQNDLDVVVVGQVLPLGLPVWLLSFVRPLRYAVFVHGMDVTTPLAVARRRWALKRILRKAVAVFAANRYSLEVVTGLGVPRERVTLVYPPLVLRRLAGAAAIAELRAREGLNRESVLITVGRLVERKGHDIVIKALESVWLDCPEVRYYIIGRGPAEARLRALASRCSRSSQVHFLGELADDLVSAWLSLATIFVMTPRRLPNGDVEGFGMVYLEAGYFQKPVIGSRSGGVPEAVIDQVTGLLVPENDVPATAKAMLQLLRDAGLRQRLGQAGYERALAFRGQDGARAILRALHFSDD